MEQATLTKHGGEPNPVDSTGLCLLSLDGGGVRGLSTLYILKIIMDRLNYERNKTANLPPVKPCEVFDLIGGTSTGGLIAIMLGRLEMDVDKCITAYSELAEAIFGEKLSSVPFNMKGKVKARFDSAELEKAVRKVVVDSGASETDLFNDGTERGCKTFVCTVDRDTKDTVRLRSFSLPHEPNIRATICQAALATSAATTFFEPVSIGNRTFADGGLGANNPVDEVEGEASNIWCSETGDLKPLVKCFLSIGTGNPGKKAFEDSIIKFLGQTVVDIATETEKTEKNFIARWAKHFDEKRYYRFNVDQGLQNIGLDEYKKKGTMEAATEVYLTYIAQKFRVRDCIQNLKLKQSHTETSFAAVVNEYIVRTILQQPSKSLQADRFKLSSDLSSRAVKKFIARPFEMKKLTDALTPDLSMERRKNFVIYGLGGAGKTQLMLEYAIAHKSEYSAVIWFNGSTINTLRQSFLENASKISSTHKESCTPILELLQTYSKTLQREQTTSVEGPKDTLTAELILDKLVSAVRGWLSHKDNKNWLLLIDNVDKEYSPKAKDPQAYDINLYMPNSDHGSVIITTRQMALCAKFNRLPITCMSLSESLMLLAEETGEDILEMPSEARTLVETVGGLPLALTQAGSYIRECGTTFSAYLEVYMSNWKDSMGTDGDEEFAPPDYAHGSVGTTFSVSYEYMKQRNPSAATFLQLLAYYHRSDIDHQIFRIDPEQTLETWQQPPPQVVQELHSLVKFNGIVRSLLAFSLLQKRGKVLEVHQVIQDWCLSTCSRSERKEYSTLALRMIGTSCNRASPVPFYSEKGNIKERLLMHASRCLALLDSDIESTSNSNNEAICRHFHVIGILFRHKSRFLDALLPLRRAFLGFKRLYGLRNLWTRRFGLAHAMNLIDLNQLNEAEQVGQEISAVAESMAGEIGNKGLLERIGLMKTLAETYWKGGKPELAEEKFNSIFDLMPEDWDGGRLNILSTKATYAEFLGHEKRYSEAIEVLLAVLRKEKEWNCLGRFSVFRITASTLVDISRKAKQFEEAEKQLLSLLFEWEEIYGSEDGWTLLIVRKLGFIYYDLGRYNEAERQFRRACSCENTELGRVDEGGLMAAHELAVNLRKQNKLTEAAVISQATLKERESLLGAEHLDTLQTRFLISLVMRDQKRYGLAAEFCQIAIEGRRKQRLDKDSLTLEYTNVLAEILFRDNQHSKAIDNWNRILQIKEHLNGSQNIEIVATLFRIGKAYREMGHLQRAEDYFQRCLPIEENSHGPNDSRVHETIFALANCLKDQKKNNDAKTLYLRLYDSLKLSNPDSVMFSDVLYFLGFVEIGLAPDKLELAESRFKECVEHRTRILGATQRLTLLATWMLAITYGQRGQLDLAADLLQSLIEGLISMPTIVDLGKTTLEDMLEEQGKVYWKQGRFEDAKTPYRRLLAQSFIRGEFPRYGPKLIRANIEDVKTANWLAASDRACDGCASKSQIRENGFHHCLSCWDVDLCAKCLDLFQNDNLSLSLREPCSKVHKFISVPAGSWGGDHVFEYDPQGGAVELDITYEQWKRKLMDDFLRETWTKDTSWMKWLEWNQQANDERPT